jgi:DNA-binding MarR family transcriptional regulator
MASATLESSNTPAPGGLDADPFAALADELLSAMAALRRSARLLARRPVELSALTGSQLDLVRLVHRRPGLSVTQAAEELRLAPNSVSTLVRQLSDAGLLVRTSDERDRRVARLELSAEMGEKVGAFRDRRIAMLSDGIARLSSRDRRRLDESVLALRQLALHLPEPERVDD